MNPFYDLFAPSEQDIEGAKEGKVFNVPMEDWKQFFANLGNAKGSEVYPESMSKTQKILLSPLALSAMYGKKILDIFQSNADMMRGKKPIDVEETMQLAMLSLGAGAPGGAAIGDEAALGMLKSKGIVKFLKGAGRKINEGKEMAVAERSGSWRIAERGIEAKEFAPGLKSLLRLPQKEWSRIKDLNTVDKVWSSTLGAYFPGRKDIVLNVGNPKRMEDTVLHEFVHARQWNPEAEEWFDMGLLKKLTEKLKQMPEFGDIEGQRVFYSKYNPLENHARTTSLDLLLKPEKSFSEAFLDSISDVSTRAESTLEGFGKELDFRDFSDLKRGFYGDKVDLSPEELAKTLGLTYQGEWEGMGLHEFMDNKTKGNFAVKSLDEVEEKLRLLRKSLGTF